MSFRGCVMKLAKLSIVTLCAVAVIAAMAALTPRLCFDGGADYTFYCGTSSADCREITANGNAAAVRLLLKDVCGESTVYKTLDLNDFLKSVNGKIIRTEPYFDGVSYFCTADLPYSVKLKDIVVNLHICVREDSVKVASPIIFGGY